MEEGLQWWWPETILATVRSDDAKISAMAKGPRT